LVQSIFFIQVAIKNNPYILYLSKYWIVQPILKILANIYRLSSNHT